MAIGDDFEIQADKDIRYTGSTANYTVLEFHEWLRGLADDPAGTPDDFLDITIADPSSKQFDTIITLVNGFNIDDTAAQHLYQGSIIQGSGATEVIYDGIEVVGPAGNYVYAVQNGAVVTPNFWTTGLNAEANRGVSHQFMIKVRTGGADIDGRRIIFMTREFNSTYLEYPVNGTSRGVNVVPFTAWATDNFNPTAVGSMTGAPYTNVALDTAGYFAQDVNADSTNEFYYSEWDLNGASVQNGYERWKYLTRRGETTTLYGLAGEIFRGITHEIDIDTGNGGTWVEPEAVSWTGGTGQLLAVDNTTAASATKMYIQLLTGVAPTDGQVISGATATNEVAPTGATSQTVSTPFCGTSTGANIIGAYGFGIQATDISTTDSLVALDGSSYSPPNYVDFTVGGLQNGETYIFVGPLGYRFQYDNEGGTPPFTVGETVTFSTPGTAKVAQVIDWGSYGELIVGEALTGDIPANDDTISGGTSGATGDVNGTPVPDVDLQQFTVSGPVSGAAVTSITVNETIPADTPNAASGGGTIRIQRANGVYTRHAYTSWTGSVFTIGSTDFSTNNIADGANCFVSYLDQLATAASETFQGIYSIDRNFFIRARDGGGTPIKTYESTGQNSSTGGSANVVRTSDA